MVAKLRRYVWMLRCTTSRQKIKDADVATLSGPMAVSGQCLDGVLGKTPQ